MPTNRTSRIRPNVDQTILHFTSLHSTHPNFPPPPFFLHHNLTLKVPPSLITDPKPSSSLLQTPHLPHLLQPTPTHHRNPNSLLPLTQQSHHSFIHSFEKPPTLTFIINLSQQPLAHLDPSSTNKQTNKQLYKINDITPPECSGVLKPTQRYVRPQHRFSAIRGFIWGRRGWGWGGGGGGASDILWRSAQFLMV